MVDQVDVVLESYRPGVAERLGVGPDDCLARNPRLVYARMTGWGQAGPLAARAGHDINYLAITGALAAIGERDRKPVPPLNLVADFGGGGMLLVAGVLAALFERATSGRGQVVDAAMVDGASYLMSMTYSWLGNGLWQPGRGRNILDGGAPYYDTYECSDGRYVAVGAIEPQFFECLISTLGLNDVPPQQDREQWPRLRAQLAETFRQKARDEWAADFAGLDACVTPVLDVDEAPAGSHLDARGTFTTQFGVTQPQPAPRFSRTPPSHRSDPHPPGADSRQVLADFGFTDEEVARLVDCRVVAPRD
jgi:alpha-methylacyl-CoA racemase